MKKEWNIFAISLSSQSLSHSLHFLSISALLLPKLLHSARNNLSSRSGPASCLTVGLQGPEPVNKASEGAATSHDFSRNNSAICQYLVESAYNTIKNKLSSCVLDRCPRNTVTEF